MHIVYWSHSYREEDADVNRHFGFLIEAAKLIVNFDPPSKDLNAAKLEQNIRSCDGMVAVLTWRSPAPSPFILYEIGLALRARKPLMVFVDDRLADGIIPPRVLQRRFSHRTYFRQVREHSHALRELKTYMGDSPGPRYQPSYGQRTCALVGLKNLKRHRKYLADFSVARGYRSVDLDAAESMKPIDFDFWEHVACLDVAVRCVDSKSAHCHYLSGAISSAVVPCIPFTLNSDYRIDKRFPREFQPCLVGEAEGSTLESVVSFQFELFEQDFVKIQNPDAIERYTRLQVEAGVLAGHYESGTRSQFVEVIMGDKYNVSGQAGAVGRKAHAHDMTFQQTWAELEKNVDLELLGKELATLRNALRAESSEPQHDISVGNVAAAEKAAAEGDGPKALQYLMLSGKWALGIAEKLGVGLAVAAIRAAMGSEPSA